MDFDRAAHGVDDAAEFDDRAVASALDDTTVMHVDRRIDQIAAQPPQPRQGAILVRAGKPAVADDVGDKDRRELPGLAHGALRGGLSLPGGTATDGAHSAGAEPRGEAGSVQAIRVPSTLSGGRQTEGRPQAVSSCPWQSRWRPRDASLRRRRPPPATSKGLRLKGAAARETLRQADERGRRHDISGGVIERLDGERLGRSAPNRRMPSSAMPALICTRLSKPRRPAHGPLQP